MARLHAKVSADCAMKGEWRKALRHNLTAIRLAPRYWRAWANLGLLLAPTSVVRPVYEGPQETLARRASVMALQPDHGS